MIVFFFSRVFAKNPFDQKWNSSNDWNLKKKVIYSNTTWSALGNQNIQFEKVLFFNFPRFSPFLFNRMVLAWFAEKKNMIMTTHWARLRVVLFIACHFTLLNWSPYSKLIFLNYLLILKLISQGFQNLVVMRLWSFYAKRHNVSPYLLFRYVFVSKPCKETANGRVEFWERNNLQICTITLLSCLPCMPLSLFEVIAQK